MDSNKTANQPPTGEITLKDLVLKMQEWGKYLLTNWLVIGIFGLAGAGLGLVYAIFEKPQYNAKLTFVLEDGKSSTLSNYTGLASQFGIDLGGNGSSGVFSGDNVLEFLKSRLLVEKTLLSPIMHEGKITSLAEYYLSMENLREDWDKFPELKNLRIPITTDRSKFSKSQDSVLNVIYAQLVKKGLTIVKPDKKLSFISVDLLAKDEVFAKVFTERLVNEAIQFYVQTKTQRSAVTVNTLQAKADSILALLNKKTYSVAAQQDMNLNPARSVVGVQTEMGSRDKTILMTMYAEVVKNLEISKLSMSQETPIIQIVDTPILPLKKVKVGKLKGIIIGGFIGGFLIVLVLFARKFFKDLMT